MGQDWFIVDLDRREFRYIGKMGEGWFDDHKGSFTRVMSRPLEKRELDLDSLESRRLSGARRPCTVDRQSPGMLSKLPLEMLRAVFSKVENIIDAAALSVTNRSLVDLGLERVRDIRYEDVQAQSWAGDRTVCLATSFPGIPDQLLTEAEVSEFSKGKESLSYQVMTSWHVSPNTDDSKRYDAHLSRRFVEVGRRDHRDYEDSSEDGLWRTGLKWMRKREITMDGSNVMDDMSYIKGWTFSPAVWVACNLTKKQYVHEDAVDAMNEEEGSPFGHRMVYCNLGFVVGVLVCWSREGDEVQRGPWAGDRVAIMPVEMMKDSEGQWEDISEDAVRKTWEIPDLKGMQVSFLLLVLNMYSPINRRGNIND